MCLVGSSSTISQVLKANLCHENRRTMNIWNEISPQKVTHGLGINLIPLFKKSKIYFKMARLTILFHNLEVFTYQLVKFRYSKNGQVLCPTQIRYWYTSDIFQYAYQRSIEQLIVFFKKKDQYVLDISPVRISEKYQTINVLW
jgi:hypothetical protein